MTTASRLLGLLSLLQTPREWPGPVLASRLGISDRTVRRDVDRLRELGYTIRATKGPEGGYRLEAGSGLPPLLFDDEQAVAIAIALQSVPAVGAGIEDAAVRALGTIRQVMPSRLRYRLDALTFATIGHGDAAGTTARSDVLVTLATAIRDRQVLRFDYDRGAATDDAEHALAPRRVEPHHLVASRGRWYLVAWDLDRAGWRIYRADRVRPRTPNGPGFAPRTLPGGDAGEFVSARFKGSDVNAWPCRGTVILNLPAAEVAPFAGDGTVTAIDEHSCSLEAGSWSWQALAASFGRFGAPMRVVAPSELRAAVAAMAERFAASVARPGAQ